MCTSIVGKTRGHIRSVLLFMLAVLIFTKAQTFVLHFSVKIALFDECINTLKYILWATFLCLLSVCAIFHAFLTMRTRSVHFLSMFASHCEQPMSVSPEAKNFQELLTLPKNLYFWHVSLSTFSQSYHTLEEVRIESKITQKRWFSCHA